MRSNWLLRRNGCIHASEAKAKRLAAEKKRLEDEEQLAAEKKRLEDAAEAKAKRLAAEKKRLEDEAKR
jgi:hypothetical protein